MKCSDFVFSTHAVKAMINRNISADDVVVAVKRGEIIADYRNDKSYPGGFYLIL